MLINDAAWTRRLSIHLTTLVRVNQCFGVLAYKKSRQSVDKTHLCLLILQGRLLFVSVCYWREYGTSIIGKFQKAPEVEHEQQEQEQQSQAM